jgi:hypothetical protein
MINGKSIAAAMPAYNAEKTQYGCPATFRQDRTPVTTATGSNTIAAEPWWVFFFLLAFLSFNIFTATSYPLPSVDECMAAEPAINFMHGQGLSAHFFENVCTYSLLLVPWVQLFGASLRSIRSADILSMTAALFVLWSTTKRLGAVTRAPWRLLMLALIATDFGVIFSYRSGRYDGFGVLLMSVAFWVMSIQSKRARVVSLFVFCLLVPWAGPQFMPVLFTAGLVLFLLFRSRYAMEVVSAFVGSVIGGAIFLAILSATGRLSRYLQFVGLQKRSTEFFSALFERGQFIHHNYIPKDWSVPFLFTGAIVLFVSLRRHRQAVWRSALSYGILFTVLLTSLLLVVAKFPTYYSYMIVVPLAVSVCSGLSMCEAGRVRTAALLLCLLSALAGAGLDAVAYMHDRRDHDYSRMENFVDQSVRVDDVAYVEDQVYIAARQRARDVYYPISVPGPYDGNVFPLMSQEQKDSITVLIVRPTSAADAKRILGGSWSETGQELVPTGNGIFGNRNLGLVTQTLDDLRVFRRSSIQIQSAQKQVSGHSPVAP